ncbi:class I SAM-dependent methyltransferase [Candidatus Gracilibacteria bacterium]|nr:class I SAM-dependent methyltransferase [Candidatus Gracilibacteria bacterium]
MSVDYNNFAKTFSNSRKKMKWEEIDYFLSFLEGEKNIKILDIGCGNGRFLGVLKDKNINLNRYLGIDLSKGLLDEAKIIHINNEFLELNMLEIDKIDSKFDYIFFIASFHHLDNISDREQVLKNAHSLLNKNGKIFMTNWALNSDLNEKRYSKSIIENSKNTFGSLDYSIKIGKFTRYYHCFSLDELKYLFNKTGFKIIENRLFENRRNFISIIQKKGD